MRTILLLLILALPAAVNAKPIRAQTLRERVIEDLKNDRDTMIANIELNPTRSEMVASLKARVLADEKRIKELGGTFEPWVYRTGDVQIQPSRNLSGTTQDAAAAKIWRDGPPYRSIGETLGIRSNPDLGSPK
jgi:hypothetical protein